MARAVDPGWIHDTVTGSGPGGAPASGDGCYRRPMASPGPHAQDTIAAIATAPGQAAIAVVRLSGPRALAIAGEVLVDREGRSLGRLASHRVRLARVRSPGEVRPIDEALVLAMHAPRSFTGEDVVEVHCHGGATAPRLVLAALLAAGARAARPGEFTERAFLNGKMDLCQAEAVADIVAAAGEAALEAARAQREGRLSNAIEGIRSRLLEIRAIVEAHLDFPEDDIPADTRHEIAAGIAAAAEAIAELARTFRRGRIVREGARVVLLGKPNVGKSSLLNALLGRDRALVSSEAGTTRDFLEEQASLGEGLQAILVDTAGLRSAGGEIERAGIARSLRLAAEADVVLAVVDSSRPLGDEDGEVLRAAELVERPGFGPTPWILVANKIDLPGARDGIGTATAGAGTTPSATARVSATTGAGLDDLCRMIRDALPGAAHDPAREQPMVTRERHVSALDEAGLALAEAGALVDATACAEPNLEIVGMILQGATASLEGLLGETSSEDVLDRVFERFCIGK